MRSSRAAGALLSFFLLAGCIAPLLDRREEVEEVKEEWVLQADFDLKFHHLFFQPETCSVDVQVIREGFEQAYHTVIERKLQPNSYQLGSSDSPCSTGVASALYLFLLPFSISNSAQNEWKSGFDPKGWEVISESRRRSEHKGRRRPSMRPHPDTVLRWNLGSEDYTLVEGDGRTDAGGVWQVSLKEYGQEILDKIHLVTDESVRFKIEVLDERGDVAIHLGEMIMSRVLIGGL